MDSIAESIGFGKFSDQDELDRLIKKKEEHMKSTEKFISSYFSDKGTSPEMLMISYIRRLRALASRGGSGHIVYYHTLFPTVNACGHDSCRYEMMIPSVKYDEAQPTEFETLAITICKHKYKSIYIHISPIITPHQKRMSIQHGLLSSTYGGVN